MIEGSFFPFTLIQCLYVLDQVYVLKEREKGKYVKTSSSQTKQETTPRKQKSGASRVNLAHLPGEMIFSLHSISTISLFIVRLFCSLNLIFSAPILHILHT